MTLEAPHLAGPTAVEEDDQRDDFRTGWRIDLEGDWAPVHRRRFAYDALHEAGFS